MNDLKVFKTRLTGTGLKAFLSVGTYRHHWQGRGSRKFWRAWIDSENFIFKNWFLWFLTWIKRIIVLYLWKCRCSSLVEHQLPKLRRRVRFPSSALFYACFYRVLSTMVRMQLFSDGIKNTAGRIIFLRYFTDCPAAWRYGKQVLCGHHSALFQNYNDCFHFICESVKRTINISLKNLHIQL